MYIFCVILDLCRHLEHVKRTFLSINSISYWSLWWFTVAINFSIPDGFDSDSSDHRKLLLFLLMTASDLSDQTKNWEGTRGTAVLWSIILSESCSSSRKAQCLTGSVPKPQDKRLKGAYHVSGLTSRIDHSVNVTQQYCQTESCFGPNWPYPGRAELVMTPYICR